MAEKVVRRNGSASDAGLKGRLVQAAARLEVRDPPKNAPNEDAMSPTANVSSNVRVHPTLIVGLNPSKCQEEEGDPPCPVSVCHIIAVVQKPNEIWMEFFRNILRNHSV